MKNLEGLKSRSQESLTHLADLGKRQPPEVQTWSVTAATAVVGALAVAAAAKGVLAVVGTLAYPPVALTAGALGGGLFGWSFMKQQTKSQDRAPAEAAADVALADAASNNEPSSAPAQ